MAVPERHLITVEEWERMAAAGVFDPDLRLELLDGEILEMSPIHPPHAECVDRLAESVWGALGDRVIVRVQGPVVVNDISVPQPDLAVLERRTERYGGAHPRPPQVFLVVEVTDTTHRRDRRKLLRYGQAGISEAWQFDLKAGDVKVHRDPGPDGYRSINTVSRAGRLSPLAFPDVVLVVDELLP